MLAELLGDRQAGFERAWEEWLATQIGPRVVGGHYDHGDDATTYEVLDIGPGPVRHGPIRQIRGRRPGIRQAEQQRPVLQP